MNVSDALRVGVNHHLAGQMPEAEKVYRAALAANGDDAAALYLLGVLTHQSRRLEESLALLERAIRLTPGDGEVQNHYSIVLREVGRLDDAIAAARGAVAAAPAMPEAHVNLGIALHMKGDAAEAISAYQRAIELKPDFGPAHNNLGQLLQSAGRFEEAQRSYRRSAELNPQAVEPLNNLGSVLQELDRPDDAIEACRAAIALKNDYPEAHNNLGNALKQRGEIAPAIEAYKQAIRLRPTYIKAHSNLLYALHFDPARDGAAIRSIHESWAASNANQLTRAAPPNTRPPATGRRLRIGYVSPDFREHALGRFMLPIINRHDRDAFEIFCYSDARAEDAVTEAIKSRAEHWRATAHLEDAHLADRVRSDEIDLLIDLALHSGRNRLLAFARRPAPVQIAYLGYPGTSGMAAMDFRLTDPYLDPPGDSDRFYTERSLRLRRTYWCYVPPPNCPDAAPRSAGPITFGCLNNFAKVSEAALRTWAELLNRVPSSRLLLHAPIGVAQQRISEIVGAERVEFVGRQTALEYLSTYGRIDIVLDPFPYTGGTTTCDALWMGVPVVTLAGDIAVRRGGVSLLNQVGLTELIAQSPRQYLDIAADVERLIPLRASLRERMAASPLMDLKSFVSDLQETYRVAAATPRA